MTDSWQSPVRPGDTLAGRYRVERVLGVGGMGVVVAARHLQLDSSVAIKFLLPDILANAEAVKRFAREARAAVKIQNEHVSRVTDVGVLENGAPYMVMEYLEGSDLGALLRTEGRLSIEDAVDYVLQASEAIAEAHSLGIVHRDLKPANLFLVRRSDGSRIVKVLDFGISKVSGSAGSGTAAVMTSTASMMGSPLYMSPEQLNSARDVDARTDVWSLGIILHELLTAELPFIAESIPQLCVAILQAPPISLRGRRPDVPQGLEAVVLRCLEKSRASRFADMSQFARALLPYAPRRAQTSVERIAHVLAMSGGLPLSQSASQTGAPRVETVLVQTGAPRVETVLVQTGAPRVETVLVQTGAPRVETVPITSSGIQAAWGHTAPEKKRPKRRVVMVSIGAAALATSIGVALFALRSSAARTDNVGSAASGSSTVVPVATEPPPRPPDEPERHLQEFPEETERSPVALEPPPSLPEPSANPNANRLKARSVAPSLRSEGKPSSPQKRLNLPGSGLE